MRSDNVWASMTEADRQRWLVKTEQQIVESKARLARCQREGASTSSAEMQLDALAERKRKLLQGPRITAPSSTAQPTSPRSDSDVQRFWQAEHDAWKKKVIAESKAREERDARLRAQVWW